METDYAALLNETQLEAVTTQEQYVRIIAGAGSGKTRVLTYRIAYLVERMGVDPHSILAVTFTNKAANEMRERVAKLVGDSAHYLSVSTFHSFCSRFLRMEAKQIGYPPSFSIFDETDSKDLIKNIAVERGHKKGAAIIKLAYTFINAKKTVGKYPDDINKTQLKSADERECLAIYREYEERKNAMFAFDFDDLILKTIEILKQSDIVRERYQYRFQHILVDEYQDTNDVQYELIRLLVSPYTNLYVVGDPDQTIYTWRGANQGIILDFPKHFAPCKDIILARNYRSTKTILDTANRLIEFNKARVKKDLYTEAEEGERVVAKRFDTQEEEAKFVSNKIREIAKDGDYSNIAVLYRSSYLTLPFEQEFARVGIPYRIFGGLRFYQRKEVKDVLAFFALFVNPFDDVAFERIYNVPKRGIGDTSWGIFKEEAKHSGLSYYDYALHLRNETDTDLSLRVIKALSDLMDKMEATKKDLKDNLEVYSSTLQKFLTGIGYFAYLVEEQEIDEDRVKNVNALLDDVTRFVKESPDASFAEYLQNISLLSGQDDMDNGNYVSLMTVHVAKGLEYDHVFIIGLNEGAFPSYRAELEKGEAGMEEERRLAYVAITRAKKTLTMTTNSAYSYTTDSRSTPSQFFKEAGIMLPNDRPSYGSVYGSSYGGRKNNGWRTVGFGDRGKSYFSDGEHIDPFEEKKTPVPQEKPADNGITDWRVGDRVHHDKFGDGVVAEIIDISIITVAFESGSKKTLLSSHPMLHRLPKPGAEA